MSALLPLTVIAACVLALLAWYLRRPPERRLRLASARFLGTLTAASQAPVRLSLATLRRTRWLAARLAILLLMATPFLIEATDPLGGEKPRLAVRILVDVSASMDIEGPEGTRLAEAAHLVRGLLATLDGYHDADVCPTTAALVDGTVQEVAPGAIEATAGARDRPRVGAPGALLVAQALRPNPPNACPVTHVVVLSDLRKPAIESPEDGRIVLWWQVGAPRPNIGLGAVTIDTDLFGVRPASISVAVQRRGGARAPTALRVTGPDGRPVAAAIPDWTLPDRELSLSFDAAMAGSYVVEIDGGGAFAGDDRLAIDVPATLLPSIDWRVDTIARPRNLRQGSGKDSVLVAPLSTATLKEAETQRAVLLIAPLAPSASGPSRIGVFVSADPLLTDLNLEVIDRAAPPAVALPAGQSWIPVLYEENPRGVAGILVARRVDPPAAIVPGPPRGGSVDLLNAGNLLLYNALSYALQDRRHALAVTRTTLGGTEIPDAFLETDTAVAVDHGDRSIPISPLDRPKTPSRRPLWPWFVVGLLALLLVERWRGLDISSAREKRP